MKNPTIEDNYEEAKRKAKELYSKIGRVWCPALGENIIFNDVGFRHLIRKGGVRRPKSEQKRRFAFLSHVEGIIKNPDAKFSFEKREMFRSIKWRNEKRIVMTRAKFWACAESRDGCLITVVVRQFNGKAKHFLSVYEKKQKPAR
jgi:hypothetical protein